MIEQFGYLLVSDIHLRNTQDQWAQSVVLRDIVRSVERRYVAGVCPAFAIVGGDLAYSGSTEEYRLVTGFLDTLAGVLKLPRRLFFPVSGNHDINRMVQTTCFAGARYTLNSAQKVDEFLGAEDERQTLLKRMAGYLAFEGEFCQGQPRRTTADGLAYISPLDVGGLPICLLGLHSSWMCGGDDDKGNLLVGDRPMIEAIELLKRHYSPRLVLGVMHHPCDWMQEFDQRSIEQRLYPACDLIHRGHLHDPVSRLVSNVPGQGCIVVAAGAGYGGRLFQNSYSYVTVDLSRGECRIETFVYDPASNEFHLKDDVRFPLRLRGTLPGTPDDLSSEIAKLQDAEPCSHYIAAIICGIVKEVPTRIGCQLMFAAPDFLEMSEDADLSAAARGAFDVANLLLAFRDSVPLQDRFKEVSDRVATFASALRRVAAADEMFAEELRRRNENCRALMHHAPATPFRNTVELMQDQRNAGEWAKLEETARQHSESTSRVLVIQARRFLVVALDGQGAGEKRAEACALSLEIVNAAGCEAVDFLNAAVVHYNATRYAEACKLLKEFVGRYGDQIDLIQEIGQKVVIETQDESLGAALGIKGHIRRR